MESVHLGRAELKELKKKNGINGKINILSFMQAPLVMVNFSLINAISRDPSHPLHQVLSQDGILHI